MTQPSPEPPPRVAHLLRTAPGGTRELVRTLLLATQSRTPALLCAPEEALMTLADAVPAAQQHTLRIESAAPHHQISAGQNAGQYATRQGARLLHGHGLRYAPLFAAASVASGLPLVVSLHNLVPSDLTGLQKVALRTAFTRADAVIAVSEAVAASAAGTVTDRARIVTIPNGVAVSRFAADDATRRERRDAMREFLQIPPANLLVVCLARLSPEKDVANLLEAFTLVTRDFPDARLCVAGEGRLRKTLEWHLDLLGLRGRAILPGAFPRERVADLLFAADIFALSSREEGLPLAVLEAMAAGLPVVATGVGGVPEAVIDGTTGLLTPPRDPVAFADGLRVLLSDPTKRRAMGDAGRTRAIARFTEAAMIDSTFALYERIARGR